MSPLTMEALQMLKFHLKKERLTFTGGWVTSEEQMTDDDLDTDLKSLLSGNFQESLDEVMGIIHKSRLY